MMNSGNTNKGFSFSFLFSIWWWRLGICWDRVFSQLFHEDTRSFYYSLDSHPHDQILRAEMGLGFTHSNIIKMDPYCGNGVLQFSPIWNEFVLEFAGLLLYNLIYDYTLSSRPFVRSSISDEINNKYVHAQGSPGIIHYSNYVDWHWIAFQISDDHSLESVYLCTSSPIYDPA